MKNTTLISACALIALAGTSLSAQVIDWASPIDGNWNDSANWAGGDIPDTIGEDAILGLIGAYTVDITNSFTIGSLSLTNPAATLEMNQNITLTLSGGILNNGFIFINEPGSVFDSLLQLNADATISGTGSIRLGAIGNAADAQLIANSGFTITNANGHTILGSGTLGGNFINNGNIIADDAIGAGLRITDTLTQGASGNTGANTGSLLLGNGSAISGGTIGSINGGEIRVNGEIATIGNTTLSGTLNIPGQSYTLALNNGLANNGDIAINSNQAVFNAHIRFDTDSTISGTGTITMFAENVFDAQIYTDGPFTGTIGAGQTITGSGIIEGRSDGTIVNNGTINGNHAIDGKTSARKLEINGNIDGSGGGIFRSDDGILNLGSGLILDGGTFDSSGVGIVDMVNGGLAILSNVTNNGQMGIRGQSSTVALTGPMTNNGNITINSNQAVFNAHLRFDTNTTIDGTGTITMFAENVFDAQIYTDGAFTGTIGAGQTITGSGIIDGRSGGTIENLGVINGNDPANVLQLDGTHAGGGMYRSDGGVLALRGNSSITGGTFDTSASGIVDMTGSGTVTLSDITNNGQMGIRGQGGIVALAGPLTNNGTILINSSDSVFNAHIRFLTATEIDGNGTINMELAGNFGDAQILNDQGFIGTIGSGQTITGSGMIVDEMNMNGTFDPSSDERRFDVDSLNLSSTSGMIADIGGLLAGEFDRLTVGAADTINLDGTLTVNLDAGYTPAFGDTWDIIDGGAITGMFADENLPAAPLGQVYRVIYQSDLVYVILTCDADLTGDNTLDFFDVSIFLNYFSNEDVRGDLNNDGAFNFFDISLFLQIFNGGCAGYRQPSSNQPPQPTKPGYPGFF